MFYDGVKKRVQSNRQFTQDIRQWHKSSIEAEKISHKEALGRTTRQNNCKPGTMSERKFAFHIYSAHVLFPNITSIKRQMQSRRVEVISTSTPQRGGTCFTMVWIIECRATDSLHKTCGNDTSLPSKLEKNISQGSIEPYNTPNNCKPETDSQQKITFDICSAHLLFPNITSIKRQKHRKERTDHLYVNSKEEWN